MQVIPALDLQEGACVRLYQGDFNQATVYSKYPVACALRWQREGAPLLHMVDLDGAVKGELVDWEVIRSVIARVSIPVQVGGGIRTLATARRLLDMGVARVGLGTVAIEDPELVRTLCQEVGSQRVVVAVDAKSGKVAVRGWLEKTAVGVMELVERMSRLGVVRFLYTDIARDGTRTEPNFEATEGLVRKSSASILASGGISTLDHVRRLARIGVEGAVIGSALYEGDIDLGDAIKAATADVSEVA